jgi:hypothetical protein
VLTQRRLKEILKYDPETGVFTWRIQKGSRGRIGSIAGTITLGGYRHIHIGWNDYKAHRLVVLYTDGKWPDYPLYVIRHKNRILDDNRRCNLEIVTKRENLAYRGKNKNNTSGEKGVTWDKRSEKWLVRIGVNNRQIYLGYFTNLKKGAAAYEAAAERYHKKFAKTE